MNIPSCISGRPSLGVVFVLNAFVVDWLFQSGQRRGQRQRLIGAIILIYPIVVTAIKDLRVGRLSINELVAIAVLAAFASGNYKTAGVVAFFMLIGEIIETRTAEGARRSIESLIKLTPTKARRLKPGRQRRGSRRQRTCRRRCHPHPPRRQRRGGRRHRQRPGFVQPGHHHRRIAAGGQESRATRFLPARKI